MVNKNTSKVLSQVLVTGASGVVGIPMTQRLSRENVDYLCVSRSAQSGQVSWDLNTSPSPSALEKMRHCQTMIHCAPIWLLTANLALLTDLGVTRLIAFSSTSVISKTNSKDPQEQKLVRLLAEAEAEIAQHCKSCDVLFTILRPSMIYGYGRDENISRIAGFIRKRGFVVLVGKAGGQRQPVHADDLVNAVMAVLSSKAAINKIYNLAGREALSYRDMVSRIFKGLDIKPVIISLPLGLVRVALRVAAMFSSFNYSPEMADRMNQDLVYSNHDAEADFGYCPQSFLIKPERDLP